MQELVDKLRQAEIAQHFQLMPRVRGLLRVALPLRDWARHMYVNIYANALMESLPPLTPLSPSPVSKNTLYPRWDGRKRKRAQMLATC